MGVPGDGESTGDPFLSRPGKRRERMFVALGYEALATSSMRNAPSETESAPTR